MADPITSALHDLLGLGTDPKALTFWQVSLRGLLVYAAALALLRLGGDRFFGRYTVYDIVLGIMIGSLLSRAINGTAPFFDTLGVIAVLIGCHWGLTALTARWGPGRSLVNSPPVCLVRDGEVQWEGMRRAHLSEDDLHEALRLQAHLTDPGQARLVYLERNGQVSVIPRG